MKIIVTKRGEKKILSHNPNLQTEDLQDNTLQTTDWVEFFNTAGKYLAAGYLGRQNKGVGWIVTTQKTALDKAFFQRLFEQAVKKRRHFFLSEDTTAFRVFNGEGDGLGGLTVDYYDRFLVISWYNQTIYAHKALLLAALQEALPACLGIYEKYRFAELKAESSFVSGKRAPEPLLVKENGITYATYLDEGLMTGIFLDQKEIRGLLADKLALGKKVLNMFSYTGAFSVAAAMGGAIETTSVDLAKRSLAKTQEQFTVNGLSLEHNQIVVMDTFDYFRYAKRKGKKFDLIVLDPPSFARNKKKTFSVSKNYGELITDSLGILNPEGLIIASTNAANLSRERFKKIVEQAFKEAKVRYQLTAAYQLPEDFAANSHFDESDYLKVLIYKIN